ncbi:hypothetical protein GCM10009541_01050 [Micromonospora gifhornensis]
MVVGERPERDARVVEPAQQGGCGGEELARTQVRRERVGHLTVEEGDYLVALAVEAAWLRSAVESVVVKVP